MLGNFGRKAAHVLLLLGLFLLAVLVPGPRGEAAAQSASRARLYSLPNPSDLGQSVTLTAEIDALGGGRPAGSVQFFDGATSLGSPALGAALGAGQATIGVSNLDEGHACALTVAGGVKCWGKNDSGQLGDGSLVSKSTAVDVTNLTSGAIAVVAGLEYSCALTSAGGVKCWGKNSFGQLGDGTLVAKSTPVDVSGLTSGVVAIAAGLAHTCAVTRGGGVKCWGDNGSGELGDGTVERRLTPTDVSGLASGAVAIATGFSHSCALLSGDAVKCWGFNGSGQLGDGTVEARRTPVAVAGLSGVAGISTGGFHTCAVLSAGGAKCWGADRDGQLGNGEPLENSSTPVDVTGLTSDAAAVSAGQSNSCALTTGGLVRCWGLVDMRAEFLQFFYLRAASPYDVAGVSDVVAISAGSPQNACAVTGAGVVKCWGAIFGDGVLAYPGPPADVSALSALVRANATLTTSALGAGLHSLSAVFTPTSAHGGSTSPTLTHAVMSPTTTSVTSSANPSDFSATITLTATVTGSGPTPTGPVEFRDGADILGSYALVGGVARASVNILAVGSHNITASYGGDDVNRPSSGSLTQVVNIAPTTTTLTSSVNPSSFGAPVTLTATVLASSGITAPGAVEFFDGATSLGSSLLDPAGQGSLTLSTFALGSHSLTAVYSGEARFAASTSAPLTQIVSPGVTTTTLTASPSPSSFGEPVTLTATVAGFGPITGTVSFTANGASLGQASVAGGVATLVTSSLPAGSVALQANYGGDGNQNGSSGAEAHHVNKANSTASLAVAPSPSSLGQTVTLTVQVAPLASISVVPTGTVTFMDGFATLGTAPLDASGRASLSTSSLAIGSHTLGASYGGDAGFTVAAAPDVVHDVTAAMTALALTPSSNHVKPGETVTLTARLTSTPPLSPARAGVRSAPATPTGEVFFSSGKTQLGAAPLDASGVATLTTKALDLGTYRFSAFYPGTVMFQAAVSPSVSTRVDYKIGPETLLSLARPGPQTSPAVAEGLRDGGAMFVWLSATGAGQPNAVMARLADPNGALAPGEITVAPAGANIGAPKVDGLWRGDYIVVWHGSGVAGHDIFMRRYAATGAPRAGAFRVNAVTAGEQTLPAVAGLNTGGYVIVWQSGGEDGSGTGIVARRFNAQGAPVGLPIPVNTTTAGDQSAPVIARLDNGGFVIGWVGPATGGASFFLQRFDASGAKVGGEVPVRAGAMTQTPTTGLVWLPGRGYVAAWSEPTNPPSPLSSLFLQRYSGDGGASGAPLKLNYQDTGDHVGPTGTVIRGGVHVMAWTAPDADLEGVAAQLFWPGTNRVQRPFIVTSTQANRQRAPAVAALGVGPSFGARYVAAWSSLNRAGTDEDVFMQLFTAP